jgi:hypothetical protein
MLFQFCNHVLFPAFKIKNKKIILQKLSEVGKITTCFNMSSLHGNDALPKNLSVSQMAPYYLFSALPMVPGQK